MNKVQAEGTAYIYFDRADEVPRATAMGLRVEGLDPFMVEQLPNSTDVRLALVRSFFRPEAADVYYLYWDDGSDLDALDAKVERGAYTDDDFRNSVKTLYQRTVCANCQSQWDTLIIPPGDPYPGAPRLLQEKIRVRAARGSFKACPRCGARLRQMVVKIFRTDRAAGDVVRQR